MTRTSHRRGGLFMVVTLLLGTLAVPAGAQQIHAPNPAILDAGMVEGHMLRVRIAPGDLPQKMPGDPSELRLDARPAGSMFTGRFG
jgi:hypothetical protein